MSIQFPSIKPNSRSCVLGTYATKTYRALSGATFKRSFGNKPFSYQIDLQFTNINDDTASQLLDHYIDTQAGFQRFTLPATLFAGMNATLQSYVQAPGSILWEYAEPPSLESLPCSRSNITIRLIGEIA